MTHTFQEFDLNPNLSKAILGLGYVEPTEIQLKSITKLKNFDGDFVGQAQTGTGKTAAFCIPLLEKIDIHSKDVQALVLAPTRELANQIENEIKKLSEFLDIRSTTIYGGSSYDKQIRSLKKDRPQIVVGTPGRVLDLIYKKVLKLNNAKFLVLDEADEMLNMGFLEDVQEIMNFFDEQRQLMMFSATMPKEILNLIKKNFKNYELVKAKKEYLKGNIDQKYFVVRNKHLKEGLARLIEIEDEIYAIVFCKTRMETKEVGQDLRSRGHKVEILNGEMKQNERDYALSNFREKRCNIIVCTDVAARGIDVQDVTHVFNFGLPQNNESYVHRIGRTARAGKQGKAYTLVTPKTAFIIRKIEKDTKQKIEMAKLPHISQLKKQLVKKEVATIEPMLKVLKEKGDSFKSDNSFELFKEYFDDLDKEQILKLMFSWKLNKVIRHYNNLEDIEDVAGSSAPRSRSRRGRSRNRDRDRSRNRNNNRDRSQNRRRSRR